MKENLNTCETFEDVDGLKYCLIKFGDEKLTERNGSIYETVRKYWRVNLKRMSKIPYVLAIYMKTGTVVEVYEVNSWHKASSDSECPDRCMFEGKQAPDEVRNLFINKRIPSRYSKKGSSNPVLYHE